MATVTTTGPATGESTKQLINYRTDRELAERVVAEIEEDGGRAVVLAADVTDPGAADQLFGALEAEYGMPVLAAHMTPDSHRAPPALCRSAIAAPTPCT